MNRSGGGSIRYCPRTGVCCQSVCWATARSNRAGLGARPSRVAAPPARPRPRPPAAAAAGSTARSRRRGGGYEARRRGGGGRRVGKCRAPPPLSRRRGRGCGVDERRRRCGCDDDAQAPQGRSGWRRRGCRGRRVAQAHAVEHLWTATPRVRKAVGEGDSFCATGRNRLRNHFDCRINHATATFARNSFRNQGEIIIS